MAHRCGFTRDVLIQVLGQAGFIHVAATQNAGSFDLWALATKQSWPDVQVKAAAARFIPGWAAS